MDICALALATIARTAFANGILFASFPSHTWAAVASVCIVVCVCVSVYATYGGWVSAAHRTAVTAA